jgi:hypothetical protein
MYLKVHLAIHAGISNRNTKLKKTFALEHHVHTLFLVVDYVGYIWKAMPYD